MKSQTETTLLRDQEHRLLTENQLARRWQRTPMTLLRMRRAGLLPFVRIGKSPRYRMADIERIEATN